jgi:hypothetical protein
MTRLLLALSSFGLCGCSLLRDPHTVPIDVVIRPVVEAKVQTPSSASLEPTWQLVLAAAVVVAGVLWLLRPRKPDACATK